MPRPRSDSSELPTHANALPSGSKLRHAGALPAGSVEGVPGGTLEWIEGASLGSTPVEPREAAWTEQNTSPHLLAFNTRYSSKEPLGQGGMGEVRILRDSWIGRDVAAKFLHERFQNTPVVRARFMREACLQGRLEHPSIVPVHDVGVGPDGRPYFTMKRIRGLTLREVIDGLRAGDAELTARFSRRKLLTAFSNVCQSIAFAHEHGVIHRDLKPSNVMLGDFGETYVLDWGIAKFIGVPETESDLGDKTDVLLDRRDRSIFGTPGYMAPEQIAGPQENLTAAADIYALGAVLFEILTYERLHAGSDTDSLFHATLDGAEARSSVRYPTHDVPPELEAICVRATAFVPRERYASVREMNDALERFLDGERDTTLRHELADAHLRAAEAAHDEAQRADPDSEVRYRSLAINSLGRALALDADNPRAMRRLVSLLLEPPSFVPQEAKEAAQHTLAQGHRIASKSIVFTSLLLLFGLPIQMAMGVRNWVLMTAIVVGVVSVICTQTWLILAQRPARFLPHASIVICALTVALSSRMFGPFFVSIGILVIYMVPISVNPQRSVRTCGFLACMAAAIFPEALEVVGVLAPSYEFGGGKLSILPHLVSFPPLQTHLVAMSLNVFFLTIIGFGVSYFRRSMEAAEERSQLYAWQLRQLLPQESRAAGSFPHAMTSPALAQVG